MKRFPKIRKATLLVIRKTSYKRNNVIYYWSEEKLESFKNVNPLPTWYYRSLYICSMKLVDIQKMMINIQKTNRLANRLKMDKLADKLVHTIPYNLRFEFG